jgi:hypothetical protein
VTSTVTMAKARGIATNAPWRSLSTAQHSRSSLLHDENDSGLPPKMKNTFGANFDWKDPLRIKNLLTDEEVCFFFLGFLLHHFISFSVFY